MDPAQASSCSGDGAVFEGPELNIVIAGVGGQGVLTAAEVIAKVACKDGFNVLQTQRYKLARRGASVFSYVRIGNVYTPMILPGQANILLGFEPIESYRAISYLNKDSRILLNDDIFPLIADVDTPDFSEIEFGLREVTDQVLVVNASRVALTLGTPTSMNMVMIGILIALDWTPLKRSTVLEVIAEGRSPQDNTVAFNEGIEEGLQLTGRLNLDLHKLRRPG